MGLKFYFGGTAGGKDGTVISQGDETAPLVIDGLYPGSATVTKTVPVAIRADAGETWYSVNAIFKGSSNGKFVGSGNYCITGAAGNGFFLPKVTDVNILLTINVSASSTDSTSPDIAVDLVAWGLKI